MIDPEENLARAGKALYAAFQRYRGLPHWGDGLDNRTDDDCVVQHRVQDLPGEQYSYYGSHAVSLGRLETAALKYFFPRVLYEAAVRPHESTTHDPVPLEMYIHNLNQLQWRKWAHSEQQAIDAFFHAWFLACLAHDAADYRAHRMADYMLMNASFLGIDTSPMLAEWHRDESVASTSQIVNMISGHRTFMATHLKLRKWDEIWGKAGATPQAIEKVVRFLASARTFSRLERAFFAATDPEQQRQLSNAVESLRNICDIWRTTLAPAGKLPQWAAEVADKIAGPPPTS